MIFKEIKRVKRLTKSQFENGYLNKTTPVIISSGLKWKALMWSPEYFENLFPEKIVDLDLNYSIPTKGKNYLKSNIIEQVSMKEAINLIYCNNNPNIKHYLSQKSLYTEFPELTQDIGMPPWKDTNTAHSEYSINLWFGEAGNATPLHYDVSHNFLIQIHGRKRIRLFAPSDTQYLYRHITQSRGPRYLSQIPDIDNLDDEKYPKLRHAMAYEGILHPKETLFIPSGWWHDIRSLDHAISINFWWKPRINECILSQLVPLRAYDLYEAGRFNEIYNFFLNINDFKNDLEVAQYCIVNKDYCLSVLFMANFLLNILKTIAMLINIQFKHQNTTENITDLNQSIILVDETCGVRQSDLSKWLTQIAKAKDENNDIFHVNDLELMHSQIQHYTKNIKRRFSAMTI